MTKNLVLEKYLKEIYEIPRFIAMAVAMDICLAFLYLAVFVASTKSNKDLSNKLYAITNKKYDVKVTQSDEPNAFCYGGLSNHIFVSKGLIKLVNERELMAVLLHEVSHVVTYDTIQATIAMETSKAFVIKFITEHLNAEIIKKATTSKTKMALALMILIIFVTVALKLPNFMLGRFNEYKSDKATVKYGYGKDLASALGKLEIDYNERKNKLSKFMQVLTRISEKVDEHPPFKKRIEKLLKDSELYEAIANNNKAKIKSIVDRNIKE